MLIALFALPLLSEMYILMYFFCVYVIQKYGIKSQYLVKESYCHPTGRQV